MENILNIKYVVGSLVYSIIGLGIFGLSFYVFDKLTPGDFWKEILTEHNTALAIIAGAMSLGLALIIASAIHG